MKKSSKMTKNNDPFDFEVVETRLQLAKMGWYTFLVHGIRNGQCTCGTACPEKKRGKHPLFGGNRRGATIDLARIRRERIHHGMNIGVHLGLSGLAVLDIDPRNGGTESLAKLEFGRKLERDVVAETGGGGLHIYFRAKPDRKLPKLLPGIDVLQDNFYPIIPPSRHNSGGIYLWAKGASPEDGAFLLTSAPDYIYNFNDAKSSKPDRKGEDSADRVSLRAPEESAAEVERLCDALTFISADCSRNDWRDIVWGIAWTEWTVAEEIARTWSQTAANLYDDEAFDAIWDSAEADRPDAITLGTIYFHAKRNGWRECSETRTSGVGDISNARAFAKKYRNRFLYISAERKWHRFLEHRWVPCNLGEEVDAAKDIAQQELDLAQSSFADHPTPLNKSRVAQAMNVYCNGRRLREMLSLAISERGMAEADTRAFDKDPMLLCLGNGVLNLKDATLVKGMPSMRLRKRSAVKFDRSADCPQWRAFLARIMPQEEKVRFIQRAIGYMLTGAVTEEKLIFACGNGANGKSVMMNVVSRILDEYAVSVSTELIARSKQGNEGERHKLSLVGSRLALMNEVSENDVWDDQKVKELASRERLTCRKLYGEVFHFEPTHKIFICGNHRPAVKDAGDAMWRRMILLTFNEQIPETERVPDLDRQLFSNEAPGILNWAIEGCMEWQKFGLQVPDAITCETNIYRKDTDWTCNGFAPVTDLIMPPLLRTPAG